MNSELDKGWQIAIAITIVILACLALGWVSSAFVWLATQYGIIFVGASLIIGVLAGLLLANLSGLICYYQMFILQGLISEFNHKYSGEPIKHRDTYAVVDAITVTRKKDIPALIAQYSPASQDIRNSKENVDILTCGSPASTPSSADQLQEVLKANEFFLCDPFSVEYRVIRAIAECQSEIRWLQSSIQKLDEIKQSVQVTIANARGNRLLENAVDRLLEEQVRYSQEERVLAESLSETQKMLSDLVGYLEIPEKARPILGLDFNQYKDENSRFEEVKASFEELVIISKSLIDLS